MSTFTDGALFFRKCLLPVLSFLSCIDARGESLFLWLCGCVNDASEPWPQVYVEFKGYESLRKLNVFWQVVYERENMMKMAAMDRSTVSLVVLDAMAAPPLPLPSYSCAGSLTLNCTFLKKTFVSTGVAYDGSDPPKKDENIRPWNPTIPVVR